MLDKLSLFEFLEVVDEEMKRKITLVAAGGTAMTLLDLKPSTIDIDFTAPAKDVDEFKKALKSIPHGFKIDCWTGGMVFSQILPEDYLEKSIPIKRMKNIELRALHPVDIVATKIGRLDEKDEQDIEACIRKYRITKSQIVKRSSQVEYVGNEENYRTNLQHVLKRFFKKEA
ncbi:MAG: hypothetical protein HYY22_11375 [Thaumarchaeota archaeon]|nr:hypothetical protein [Nitrososphaerota archaeon]